jgi:hypothetical protein
MAFLTPQPRIRFFDEEGVPLAGGFVYTYAAGTTTPLPTFTDQSGSTPNPNPVPLDSDGGASIWFDGAYKIDVKKSTGVSLQGYPVDNVNIFDLLDWSDLTASIDDLNATDTSTLTKTTTYTVALSDRGKTILCDATSAGFTITLPPVAQATNGFEISFKKIDVTTNLITLDGNGSETIEGRTTFLLYDQNDIVTILCDGNNWRVKSGVIRGNTQLISGAYTATIADINKTFICSATAAYAVTLLSAAVAGDGFRLTFKKINDEETITLTPAGIETIDGQSSLALATDYQCVTIVSNGANWFVLNENNVSASSAGDVKISIDPNTPVGWIPVRVDGTIGSAASNSTIRANADTRNLFVIIWNATVNSDCPIFNSDGTVGTRGASALADFSANKRLTVPKLATRVIGAAGSGTPFSAWNPGETTGEESHTLTIGEMPAHTHAITNVTSFAGPAGAQYLIENIAAAASPDVPTTSTGGGDAHNNMQPSVFLYFYMKL